MLRLCFIVGYYLYIFIGVSVCVGDVGKLSSKRAAGGDDEKGDFRGILTGSSERPKPLLGSAVVVKLPENYTVHQPPPLINGQPVPVYFSILIFGIFDIMEMQGDITLEANVKIFWKDLRLANLTRIEKGKKYVVLNPSLITQIWHPDTFIDHMRGLSQPSLISRAASLRIYPDGSLRYSARMLINLSCRMDFYYYPADTQKCTVDIKSYSYSTQHLTLGWKDGQGPEMAYFMDLHNFDVALDTGSDYIQTTRSASYSGIRFAIHLRRKLSYHMIQTFIPSSLFTIVSWLSYLVPPESTPGRMALCVTTLLTLTAMFSSVRQNVPSVSYVKALDLWMVTCIVFVFSVLAEYTIYLKLKSISDKREDLKKRSKKAKGTVLEVESMNRAGSNSGQIIKRNSFVLDFNGNNAAAAAEPLIGTMNSATISPIAKENEKPGKYFMLASRMEKYTPRILPLLFLIFNFIYWPYLLIRSDYYNFRLDKEMYYSID